MTVPAGVEAHIAGIEIECGLGAVEAETWLGLAPEAIEDAIRLAAAACRAELAGPAWPARTVVGVLLASDADIAELNARWRDRPSPTNVLSWPAAAIEAGDPPGAHWGELAFAEGVVERQAAARGWPARDYLTHLAVHGLAHCLGYDHETDREADLMEGAETRILARLGLPDPYAEPITDADAP